MTRENEECQGPKVLTIMFREIRVQFCALFIRISTEQTQLTYYSSVIHVDNLMLGSARVYITAVSRCLTRTTCGCLSF